MRVLTGDIVSAARCPPAPRCRARPISPRSSGSAAASRASRSAGSRSAGWSRSSTAAARRSTRTTAGTSSTRTCSHPCSTPCRAPRSCREYLECRRILEIEAAALAAERATEQHLAALSDAFARMSASAARARGEPGRGGAVPRGRHRLPSGADRGHRQPRARQHDRARAPALAAARRPLARPEHRRSAGCPSTGGSSRRSRGGDPSRRPRGDGGPPGTVEGYLRSTARRAPSASRRARRPMAAEPRAGRARARDLDRTTTRTAATPGARLRAAGLRSTAAPKTARAPRRSRRLARRRPVAAIVSTDPFDRAVFDAAPRLRVVARVGVGTDSIDLDAATAAGVVV